MFKNLVLRYFVLLALLFPFFRFARLITNWDQQNFGTNSDQFQQLFCACFLSSTCPVLLYPVLLHAILYESHLWLFFTSLVPCIQSTFSLPPFWFGYVTVQSVLLKKLEYPQRSAKNAIKKNVKNASINPQCTSFR